MYSPGAEAGAGTGADGDIATGCGAMALERGAIATRCGAGAGAARWGLFGADALVPFKSGEGGRATSWEGAWGADGFGCIQGQSWLWGCSRLSGGLRA